MDRWLGKVVELLDSEDRELRRAAARVLEALRPSASVAVDALGRALSRQDRALRKRALEALGAIGGPSILEHVLPLLEEEGELGRRAAAVLASSDPRVLGQIKKRFATAGPFARRRMLRIAVLVRGADGMDLLVRGLEKGHADDVLHLGDRLAKEMQGATARERNTLSRRIDKFLASRSAANDPDATGAAVDLIARVLGPDSLARLLEYGRPSNPGFVRRRALEAIARVAPTADLDEADLTQILTYLRETDYGNVVAPAMAVLERAKLAPSHAAALLKNLQSNDPALRRFAVTALGQLDAPKAAAALLNVLAGENPDLRKRAALSLSHQDSAVPLVVGALGSASDTQMAWVLARILLPHAHRLTDDEVASLAKAAAVWLEPGDPRAEAVISVIADRHMDALADAGLKRLRRLKRGRDAGGIVNLMRPLLRNGSAVATAEIRYEVALAEIVRGKKDVLRETRLANPGLQALELLLHEADFGLMARLKREKVFLTPEEYFLIGCHFAERPFLDRIFGGEILTWVAKTFPEDSASQAATHKLEIEGFPPPPQPRARKKPAKPKPKPKEKATAKKVAKKKATSKKTAKKKRR